MLHGSWAELLFPILCNLSLFGYLWVLNLLYVTVGSFAHLIKTTSDTMLNVIKSINKQRKDSNERSDMPSLRLSSLGAPFRSGFQTVQRLRCRPNT